jgi:hypothetical protein
LPNLPESPACGFSAHNAILGSAIPNHSRNPSRVMRAASVIVSMLSDCVTWLNGMWVVASTTRSLSEASIIATREPVRLPSISV